MEFSEKLDNAESARMEAQLQKAGILDALVVTEQDMDRIRKECPEFQDTVLFLKENGNYIYEWNAIDQLVYLMVQSSYLYVTGHLQIRHLADLYVFYRKAAEEDKFQELETRLRNLK